MMWNELQKAKPVRSKKYLDFVRSLPCCYSGKTDDIQAHHIISSGLGGVMGSKVSDIFTIPLHAVYHAKLHSFPQSMQIDQNLECLKVIDKALREGVISIE